MFDKKQRIMKDLIGRKVRGFKFEDKKYHNGLSYCRNMDKYIGVIGTIKGFSPRLNAYEVHFEDVYWHYYPAELIEQHLVEEPIDRDVLRQELEKFADWYKKPISTISIVTKQERCINEYFEYLDKEENPTKELTLQEIADKFNVPVDKIRIKE